jgi:organic radical activating enzyme
MSSDEVWVELVAKGVKMIVVTGGEPLLQQSRLASVFSRARDREWWVEVETAGTVMPDVTTVCLTSRFNVSPKLSNSGNDVRARYRPEVIEALQGTGKAVWKFVVESSGDLGEVADLVDTHRLEPVYIMPEGTDPSTLLERSRELCDAVLSRGWNMTSRLQILLHGNVRGV